MATTTENTVLCAGCGAKIPRTVSICPYCVTPTQAPEAATGVAEATRERLGRMQEKEEFALAMQWTPPPGPAPPRALRRGRRGNSLLVVAGLVFLGGSVWSEGPRVWLSTPLVVLPLALVAWGLTDLLAVRRARAELARGELIRRAARIAGRRSETTVHRNRGETTYFFQIEFADGTEGEFAFPGRGASHEPLTAGVTGVAYTRGPRLLAFERIRV
ncbi:MAG: hypothetical protein QF903_12750 [Planctomycetota bacterium]|jgi:hypothetical protein|nr:hypothetical protein [Planctomycetota bacterium]MDP6762281.1 hypothetical protein [Planctomycetota bacterium]MDP6990331.1 hypothetical protein [Planctomycetota bacterium]